MPLDGRPAHRAPMTDEDIDRAIMQGSPFAMPAPAAAETRSPIPYGELARAIFALAMVFAVVAGFGAAWTG